MRKALLCGVCLIAFPMLHAQVFSGRIYRHDKKSNPVQYDYDQLSLQVNPDSTVIYTRIHINTHPKHKEAFTNCYVDSITYYLGWIRTVDDTTRKIILNNTYAVAHKSSATHSYSLENWLPDNDTMPIQFDSVRIKLPPYIRIVYEDGFDTVYQIGDLTYYFMKDSFATAAVGDWQRSTILNIPMNEKRYARSRYLFVDIGLINPQTKEPLLYKVERGTYPLFMNWHSFEGDEVFLINGRSGYHLEGVRCGPVEVDQL